MRGQLVHGEPLRVLAAVQILGRGRQVGVSCELLNRSQVDTGDPRTRGTASDDRCGPREPVPEDRGGSAEWPTAC